MYEKSIVIKQGVAKKPPKMKISILENMQIDWLKTVIFELELTPNHHYFNNELNAYFYELFADNCSGNMGVNLALEKYGFSLMDQQTASERVESFQIKELETMMNQSMIEQAKKLPTHNSDYKLAKVKSKETMRRRKLAERAGEHQRKRQRERGIDPPEGRYLALDPSFKPSNMDINKIREEEHPMAWVLTKDRRKRSTTTFTGHHTVYDFEHGSRQILSTHMMMNKKVPGYKAGWKREGLDEAVKFLLDPILEEISVKGVVGDGDYRNIGVIQYLQDNELDYVIRENMNDDIRDIIEKENLEEKLDDGYGFEVEGGVTMGRGKNQVTNRLVIVNRNAKLTPLLLAPYSELTPEQALLLFEERFGIETVFREIYKYLPTTTSKVPQYRTVLYGMTAWFYNLLLNYYQIVVVFSSDPSAWDISLQQIKDHADQLFADLLISMVTGV